MLLILNLVHMCCSCVRTSQNAAQFCATLISIHNKMMFNDVKEGMGLRRNVSMTKQLWE